MLLHLIAIETPNGQLHILAEALFYWLDTRDHIQVIVPRIKRTEMAVLHLGNGLGSHRLYMRAARETTILRRCMGSRR